MKVIPHVELESISQRLLILNFGPELLSAQFPTRAVVAILLVNPRTVLGTGMLGIGHLRRLCAVITKEGQILRSHDVRLLKHRRCTPQTRPKQRRWFCNPPEDQADMSEPPSGDHDDASPFQSRAHDWWTPSKYASEGEPGSWCNLSVHFWMV